MITSQADCFVFLQKHKQYKQYHNDKNTIMIGSPGRSGSTLLTDVIKKSTKKTVLKTHLLTPRDGWKGKILYIFSNPYQLAESSFHLTLNNSVWGTAHFNHVETSDESWLQMIGNTTKQTLEHNLLNYDALGIAAHLYDWLLESVTVCEINQANVLAIKYEHLWDPDVVQIIKEFCEIDTLYLPKKKSRGYPLNHLTGLERIIRNVYNIGSEQEPKYKAYDRAKKIWEKAPKYMTLKISHA